MTLDKWVRNNRKFIDDCVHDFTGGGIYPQDDNEREDWVLNDEFLYRTAEEEGVDFDE